jgi:hypothetical protein
LLPVLSKFTYGITIAKYEERDRKELNSLDSSYKEILILSGELQMFPSYDLTSVFEMEIQSDGPLSLDRHYFLASVSIPKHSAQKRCNRLM